jgi:hypothetical protein
VNQLRLAIIVTTCPRHDGRLIMKGGNGSMDPRRRGSRQTCVSPAEWKVTHIPSTCAHIVKISPRRTSMIGQDSHTVSVNTLAIYLLICAHPASNVQHPNIEITAYSTYCHHRLSSLRPPPPLPPPSMRNRSGCIPGFAAGRWGDGERLRSLDESRGRRSRSRLSFRRRLSR